MSQKREIAPRKERRAFYAVLLAAVVIAMMSFLIVRHSLHVQHPPVAAGS